VFIWFEAVWIEKVFLTDRRCVWKIAERGLGMRRLSGYVPVHRK